MRIVACLLTAVHAQDSFLEKHDADVIIIGARIQEEGQANLSQHNGQANPNQHGSPLWPDQRFPDIDWPECERCAGADVESQCCVKTSGGAYTPFVAQEVRCYDPSIDACAGGQVCPASTPAGCCLSASTYGGKRCNGDIQCYNPDTHTCLYQPKSGYQLAGQVCPESKAVACGGNCYAENDGFCCADVWHPNEANKQCCAGVDYYGAGAIGHEEWVCDASQQCVGYSDPGYSVGAKQCLD